MALPALSPQQRAEALTKAQAARQARKHVLAQVAAGELTVAQVLNLGNSDPVVAKTKVSALVAALPGYGAAKTATVMAAAHIVDNRRVGGLGAKQRDALVNALS
jgi:hypothetical protein